MLHPEMAMALADQHRRDLIAEADRQRLLSGARRQPGPGKARIGKIRALLRVPAGDTLPRWGDRVAVPPR